MADYNKKVRNRSRKISPRRGRKIFLLLVVIAVVAGVALGVYHNNAKAKPPVTNTTKTTQVTKSTVAKTTTPAPVNQCAGNTLPKLILVNISARHLWACENQTVVYNSAVVTGMEFLPADLTPTGTYHIYGKLTNTYLKGCDTTGCWNDYVNYFLEFLDNQYGVYGIHDATWRAPTAFGNISPNSPDASHGCVETPLATATFLYNWAPIGTTVTVQA